MPIDRRRLMYNVSLNLQKNYFKHVYKVNDITKKIEFMPEGEERTRLEKHLKKNIARRDAALVMSQSIPGMMRRSIK